MNTLYAIYIEGRMLCSCLTMGPTPWQAKATGKQNGKKVGWQSEILLISDKVFIMRLSASIW